MSLTSLIVPSYSQMLSTLAGCLQKAQSQLPDEADGLLSARLAPDMFPLSTQVRFVCVQAYEAVSRLRGEPFPAAIDELLGEGRNADEQPGTMADAFARIDQTIAMLDGLDSDALDRDLNEPIVHELPNGMIFDLTAEQYARDWTLPQFYFHLVAAYAILRNQNVELGKADYCPHMFAYLRPESMPKG